MNDQTTSGLLEALAETTRQGAEYADIFLQAGVGHSAHFEDGRIEELSSSNADGCGARVIAAGKTFYAHAPGAALSAVEKPFTNAAESALGRAPKLALSALSNDVPLVAAPVGVKQPDIAFLHNLDKEIRTASRFVRQVAFRYRISERNVMIVRSDGKTVRDNRNYCTFSVQVIAEKDGIVQTGSERRSMAVPHVDFWCGAAPEKIAHAALSRALLMLDAKPCPAGRMKILLAGEAGGTIIHEACGHGLEADIVEKDFSVYKDMIGQRVAAENITMIDDPTPEGLYGSYRFDDEGTSAQKNVLIENGVLKRYLTDVLSSLTYGMELTGNGRRESYRNIPVPRMSNTYLLPGETEYEEMLARMGDGLLVKKMGGGEVNPTTGDFVFYVSEAYLVEKGRVKHPVRGAILTGNGPQALKDIVMLGKNLIMDPGVCGKSGQGVPVTDGQPSMLIDGLTVGGSEA